MKIVLNRKDIEEALVEWVKGQGITLNDKSVNVDVTVTRNEATVDIKTMNQEEEEVVSEDPVIDSTKPLFQKPGDAEVA